MQKVTRKHLAAGEQGRAVRLTVVDGMRIHPTGIDDVEGRIIDIGHSGSMVRMERGWYWRWDRRVVFVEGERA